MIFDRNENKPVIALLGAGSMGTAIVRRIAAGKKILLGDISEKNLERVSNELKYSGYDVETIVVNALEKESVEAFAKKAASLGPVMYFIDTAGASPSQAKPEHILKLDMVGTGYAVDAFGEVMAEGGAGLASALVNEGLADAIELFVAPIVLGRGSLRTFGAYPFDLPTAPRYRVVETARCGADLRIRLERDA